MKQYRWLLFFSVLAIVIVLVLLVPLTKFSNTNSTDVGKKRITLLIQEKDDRFWDEVIAGVLQQMQEEYSVQIVRCKSSDYEAQKKRFEMALAAQVDGMIAQITDNTLLEELVIKARVTGIPVVLVGSAAPDTTASYVGNDNVYLGKLIGAALIEATGGSAEVAVVAGEENQQSQLELLEGFSSALKAYPGMNLISTSFSGMDAIQASEITQYLLKAHPEINAFFGTTAEDITGIARIIDDRLNKESYHLVGLGTTDEILKWVNSGLIHTTVQQNPLQMGQQSAIMLKRMIEEGDLAKVESVFTDFELISTSDMALPAVVKTGETP